MDTSLCSRYFQGRFSWSRNFVAETFGAVILGHISLQVADTFISWHEFCLKVWLVRMEFIPKLSGRYSQGTAENKQTGHTVIICCCHTKLLTTHY